MSDRFRIPLIGLGTWNLRGKECTQVVHQAIEMGYRHIDTAHIYENHRAIGKALPSAAREELFITSKFGLDVFALKEVEKSCEIALKELGIDYLDLYLIHWPDRNQPIGAYIEAMERLRSSGKTKAIGVSNFTIHHLQDIEQHQRSLAANQVEFHPYLYQKELWQYCEKRHIQLIAYRSLGKGALLQDPLFGQIGKKYGKSPAQVILRWIIQKGIPVIPKASSPEHLAENLAIFDFSLSEEEETSINHLDRGERFCSPDWQDFNY